MIIKISGKGKTGGVGHLNVNNNKITDLKEITNTLAHTFENIPRLIIIRANSNFFKNRQKKVN